LFSEHFFLENKTRKSKVVKLHLIRGEPVSVTQTLVDFYKFAWIFSAGNPQAQKYLQSAFYGWQISHFII
jgi:hypothetical protein